MDYSLDMPSRSWIGAGARRAAGAEAARLGWARLLLASDPYLERTGRVEEIRQLLESAGLEVSDYNGITGEPDTEMVKAGLERYRQDGCEAVVALGGGSVIDVAKTIAVMAQIYREIYDA